MLMSIYSVPTKAFKIRTTDKVCPSVARYVCTKFLSIGNAKIWMPRILPKFVFMSIIAPPHLHNYYCPVPINIAAPAHPQATAYWSSTYSGWFVVWLMNARRPTRQTGQIFGLLLSMMLCYWQMTMGVVVESRWFWPLVLLNFPLLSIVSILLKSINKTDFTTTSLPLIYTMHSKHANHFITAYILYLTNCKVNLLFA